ncbi:MAG: fasciclin domain-containing protein [Gemmatimonadaceae bacterium]|nr:fasciclin domain-containing protein [Gemmatimonadaceae bacterium]
MRKLSLVVASSAVVAMAAPAIVQAQDKDLVETALAASSFKTFTRALTDAGLVETLKGPGPFTVLIPNDAAFAKLPKGTLDALFKDKSALRNMLLYHLIAGRLTADDFSHLNGKGRKTVEGSETRIGMTGTQLTIGTANVVQADVMAKNGIIHVIDTVLIPPGR